MEKKQGVLVPDKCIGQLFLLRQRLSASLHMVLSFFPKSLHMHSERRKHWNLVVFNKNNTKYEQKIQIARGIAFHETDSIDLFAAVFREADHAMYENKVMQKSKQTDPPVVEQSQTIT